MPKLDQEEYLKLSTDIERDMGLSLDIENFWTESYAEGSPVGVMVKEMYGNEGLPTLGN